MKTVDLRDTPTYLINLESQSERLEDSSKLLGKLDINFKRAPGVPHERGIVGCGMAHLNLLREISPTSLVLEDDIAITPHFSPKLKIPENVDAVYLGISVFGYHPERSDMGYVGIKYEKYSEDYFRILNMCSAHAILYVSQRFIDATIRVAEESLQDGTPWDLKLASIHKDYTVITPTHPMFYQKEQAPVTHIQLPAI
tara:strand:+ start:103 stop:696 length:594 start_codon:yes stop_codon:yes gene_type:complete